jgi:predicted TIM-barrel fold metal-dependent hydrolase
MAVPAANAMPVADSHHHLWDLKALRYPWLQGPPGAEGFSGDTSPLRRDYLIDDFLADSTGSGVVRSVHVQAEVDRSDPVAETRWLQGIADAHGFPHGIVAFVALDKKDAETIIEGHCQYANMRGVRQLLNWHSNPAFRQTDRADYMMDPGWRRGFALLARYGLSFDFHVHPSQMDDAASLVNAFPETSIVIDHTGLPLDRDEAGLSEWRRGMRTLARSDNVAVKISGLGMFDHHWTAGSVRPFIEETIEIFGPGRCMFGSNFPVDRLYSDYARVVSTFRQAIAGYTPEEQQLMLHDNAVRFYRLS